ncbi:alpha/beta hydrolase [Chitinophaga nivalis]|uniref:Alpha/beta hydrolase n=1 Tax=Chitinophaga nivalis TaxID=2991709 RepID=A0ABT3IQA0_9BACT|nr:alpha/beta hydrolase [Chitinophaga nivalis]MCW3464171.1 alpha/beta hydrolase [Chitinophaga nivalis]MCW3486139.1 alpha/beta hydrolase [Chitinophaga nivalis]
MGAKLNIILVHGAWGDGSHWRHVIPQLDAKGYNVTAVQNPLTSLADDVDRTRRLAKAQDGPVLLVGHSYGGAVITGAGHESNVVGLVYVAAFAPDKGESLGSILGRTAPTSGGAFIRPDADGFLWIAREGFHESFCQDLDKEESLVMALSQKPIAGRCFADESGEPAWRVKPSWYQVSSQDHMIPPETEAWLAERMQTQKTITLDASHASLASRPDEIIALIDEAAKSFS